VTEEPRVPVRFPLGPNECHGQSSESVWTESLDGKRFVVLNTPFFIKGVSFEDQISAVLGEDGYTFREVVGRGGHSTYRIVVKGGFAEASDELARLEAMGCTWEDGPGDLLALDVPPGADIEEVYASLEAGVDAGVWDFEEGHLGHAIAR